MGETSPLKLSLSGAHRWSGHATGLFGIPGLRSETWGTRSVVMGETSPPKQSLDGAHRWSGHATGLFGIPGLRSETWGTPQCRDGRDIPAQAELGRGTPLVRACHRPFWYPRSQKRDLGGTGVLRAAIGFGVLHRQRNSFNKGGKLGSHPRSQKRDLGHPVSAIAAAWAALRLCRCR